MELKSLATPYRIIKILKMLTEKPLSMDEILLGLESEDIFINKETITKYFKTLREAGCTIEKRKNKFYIKYPILGFSPDELETLAGFEKIASNINSKANYGAFCKFLEKIFTLANADEYEKYKKISLKTKQNKAFWSEKISSKYKEKIETLSRFMYENSSVINIIYENKNYSITPLSFCYYKDSVSLLGYDNKKNVNKNFTLDKLTDIKGTPITATGKDFGLSTTFKITGRLKKSYTLKEGEIAVESEEGLIITNNKEDKKELFNRLLKYGDCCEILYPKNDRENFINLVENLITNSTRGGGGGAKTS